MQLLEVSCSWVWGHRSASPLLDNYSKTCVACCISWAACWLLGSWKTPTSCSPSLSDVISTWSGFLDVSLMLTACRADLTLARDLLEGGWQNCPCWHGSNASAVWGSDELQSLCQTNALAVAATLPLLNWHGILLQESPPVLGQESLLVGEWHTQGSELVRECCFFPSGPGVVHVLGRGASSQA